ncbi:MAG TPA: hypothetical protein VIU46_10990 [Gallionellaceae bacterium]
MTKYYAAYCIALVSLLGYANAQGYIFGNIFDSQSSSHQSANHYHK